MRELLHRGGPRGAIALLWEPRDVWVGLYWTRPVWEGPVQTITLYVCIVPLLPVRITRVLKEEWMMGWSAGWVSALDLRRTAQIKIIGNGVAPRQAVAAYRHLLEVAT